MANYRNDLEEFVYEYCFNQILHTTTVFVAEHPAALDLTYSRIKYPDTATLMSLIPEFVTNIAISEDTLSFDAIMSGIIELSEENYGKIQTNETKQWLRISCIAIVTDKFDSLTVEKIIPYKKGFETEKEGIAASSNIVPIIRKDELDQEAESFLAIYYKKALERPCPVPILDIAETDYGLTVIQGKCITKDFSIFGQICFADGEIELYEPTEYETFKKEVSRGTIIIDAMTFFDRNLGCVNNTLAHEIYHWHRHRLYASIKRLLKKGNIIAHRCPVSNIYPSENEPWTDEQRMEWQANKIAPRILMPLSTFTVKVQELMTEYDYENATDKDSVMECIIDELADFYRVSRQSAKIRLIDIGYAEAANVYNYAPNAEPCFSVISSRDAFYEYHDNPEFRELINSGLFVYANNFFVINDPKYVIIRPDGSFAMTDYGWKNLGECTIQFTYRKVDIRIHGQYHTDTFHRDNHNIYEKLPQYDASKNASVVAHAAELQAKRAEFEKQYAEHQEYTSTFWEKAYELMNKKGWDVPTFCMETGLNEIVYSRAKNNHNSLPDVRTVISICAGLDLDISMTTELLRLAGHTLTNSREHQAYSFIITGYKGKSIYERNEFLAEINVPLLGSKQRK